MASPINPLHPDIIPRLDPEYAAYYNDHLANVPPLHTLPWNPEVRKNPPVAGASEPLNVGLVKDIPLSKCKARVFWPEDPSKAPEGGWPVFLFFHGGGWTLGNINTENHLSTRLCLNAKCVVVSVDYRLAPEQPYPAAVEDAVDAMTWIFRNGKAELKVDLSRFAVGGSSSGANLAAILTHKAVLHDPPIPLAYQILIVPVMDNTADVDGHAYPSWLENRHTPALDHGRMLWFRNYYLPNEEDRKNWDASPIFASEESFSKIPDAWIAVAELDILRDEGIAYAKKMREAGRKAEVKVYEQAPHPIMAMDGLFGIFSEESYTDPLSCLYKPIQYMIQVSSKLAGSS